MNLNNSITIVKAFNDCINNQDIDGLAALMSEDHTFIDRDGSSHGPKSHMVEGWKQFFEMFALYKNTFDKINIIHFFTLPARGGSSLGGNEWRPNR